jgi:hypothetical protein
MLWGPWLKPAREVTHRAGWFRNWANKTPSDIFGPDPRQ